VHHHEAARSGKQLAHFSKSDLIAGEDEDIESDVLAENALYEGVVIFFGIGEMGNVLALAQLLGRSHLLLEIWPYGNSGASRARISHQIHDSRREDGYLSHADRNIDGLTQTAVLSLIDVDISFGAQIFNPGDDRVAIFAEWHYEALVDI